MIRSKPARCCAAARTAWSSRSSACSQRLGTGHIIMNMKIGNLADSVVKRSMELFRDKVRPQVAVL